MHFIKDHILRNTYTQTNTKKNKQRLTNGIIGVLCALGLTLSLTACGSQDTQVQMDGPKVDLPKLTGVTITKNNGKAPTVHFDKQKTLQDKAYAILDKGNASAIHTGDKLCTRTQFYDIKTGKLLQDTWKNPHPDCAVRVTKQNIGKLYPIITFMKSNGVLALTSGKSYLLVISFIKTIHVLDKANGTPAVNIPKDLPKVTLAKNGIPSIQLKGYKPTKKLIAQNLINGNGEVIKPNDTVTVHYSGWLLNGKEFDSSWKRNEPFDANLSSGVIRGWKQGLTGKKVGSQVLLIIPPSLGYGAQKQGSIPANSTLVFVVDILATSHN